MFFTVIVSSTGDPKGMGAEGGVTVIGYPGPTLVELLVAAFGDACPTQHSPKSGTTITNDLDLFNPISSCVPTISVQGKLYSGRSIETAGVCVIVAAKVFYFDGYCVGHRDGFCQTP